MTALLRTTLLLASAATLAAQQPTIVDASVKMSEMTRESRPPVAPLGETATLSKTAPTGVTAPGGLADGAFGTVKLGEKTVAVAAGKGAADAARIDTLWIDANADGKWSDDERHALEVTESPARGNAPAGERSKPVDWSLKVGSAPVAAKASFTRQGDGAGMVRLTFPSYLEATTDVGGQQRVIAIVDKDFDGTFGSKGDMWALAKSGDQPASAFGLSLLGEKRFLEGQLVGITVDKNKVHVTSAAATGPDAKDAAAHRNRVEHEWAARFDKERDNFIAQRKLDTSRARATKPIDWQYVSFDEAIALGKKANKPVFVDVMAFWCVWCYRMDYYTYVDQEVADMLSTQFVPCKIVQEQDLAGDYDRLMKEKLEAKGIPAMGIFGTDGSVLVKIGGWKGPTDFLAELRQGLEAFKAANAPK